MNMDLRVYDSVTSTQEVLMELSDKGAREGTAVLAWEQSAGRGRIGRTFQSPKGGIYLSVLLPLDDGLFITSKVAVAVRRAIQNETDKRCYIKWVNDIIYNGKKVCGILTQVHNNYAVVGIGINFATQLKDFPPEVRDIAASLYRYPQEADCEELDIVNAILREIDTLFSSESTLWIGEYGNASNLIGKRVNIIRSGKVVDSGTVSSIDDNCHLHVDINGTDTEISSGEVSIREA